MYVLLTIDGRIHMISQEQKDKIATFLEGDTGVKTVGIGDSLIVLHQITGIVPMETYHRQMQQKLSAKKQRMCKKCGTIITATEKCPCTDMPEKFPSFLESARKENPQLAAALDGIAESKSILQIANAQH